MNVPSQEPAFVTLFESQDLPRFELPSRLEQIYGAFGLAHEVVYANFVSSLDGAVAFEGVERASPIISAGSIADRFIVGLLRATADAVVIGAGTYRAHSGPWTAANAYPVLADEFGELRRRLGAPGEPALVVVTHSGNLGPPKPGSQRTIIASPRAGSPGTDGADRIDLSEVESTPRAIVDELRGRGFARVLTEGGPRLMGEFLSAHLVDELFLTISPLMFGAAHGQVVGIANGAPLESNGVRAKLTTVRKDESHLFLRYTVEITG